MAAEVELRFRDYLHQCKESGHGGTDDRGDFTMTELRDLAREFLDHQG